MGLLDFITGAGSATKAAENATEIGKTITDGIVSGLDALVFTEEEKAQYSADSGKLYLKFWETFGHENSEQSKARRELAKMTFRHFWNLVYMLIATKSLSLVFPQIIPLAETIFTIIFSTVIVSLVLGVGGTYFVPHQLSKLGNLKDISRIMTKKNE